jgi:nitrate reductase NapAB chaperone NapD
MATDAQSSSVLSGVLVRCRPESLPQLTADLDGLAWADVHQVDPAGRMVVTTEAADIHEGMDQIGELRAMTGVLAANLAEFRFVDTSC